MCLCLSTQQLPQNKFCLEMFSSDSSNFVVPTWLRLEGDHLAREQVAKAEGGEEEEKEDRSREPHHRCRKIRGKSEEKKQIQ